MELPQRKMTRLPQFDYSSAGAYFVTICTRDKKNILAHIVGGGAFDAPQTKLTPLGQLVEKYLRSGNRVTGIHADKYVVMPNHIHLILFVDAGCRSETRANERIPHFVSTFKRLCYRDVGHAFLQRSYHDHVIRSRQDYLRIWKYIDHNPARWLEDCYYSE